MGYFRRYPSAEAGLIVSVVIPLALFSLDVYRHPNLTETS